MQGMTIQHADPVHIDRERVWDLSSVAPRRPAPRARRSHAGPVAAAFGVAALLAAAIPSAESVTRLFFIIGFGGISALVGFSALRRRQTSVALLLALVGVAAPAIAITCVVLQTTHEPATVTSSTVQRATLQPDSSALVPTREFDTLSIDERDAMKAFVSATAQQIQSLHGAWAPLPSALQISGGTLVESDGLFRGTALGAVPPGQRLTYEVARDGSAFRIAITSSKHPGAMVSADRGLQILTADG
jgi:hypothetical protein